MYDHIGNGNSNVEIKRYPVSLISNQDGVQEMMLSDGSIYRYEDICRYPTEDICRYYSNLTPTPIVTNSSSDDYENKKEAIVLYLNSIIDTVEMQGDLISFIAVSDIDKLAEKLMEIYNGRS